jgi:hypothetical protein
MELAEAPEDRATRYRRTAAQLRRQADGRDDRQERAELLIAAGQYERVADRLARVRDKKAGA